MADHEFRIESDSPVNNELMFWRIEAHEALARPSAYEITVLSKNRALDAKDILGRAYDVVIEFQDKEGGKHERRGVQRRHGSFRRHVRRLRHRRASSAAPRLPPCAA